MMFLSLSLIDHLSMFYSAPSVLFQAVCVTAIYYQTRALKAPLWMARQNYVLGIFGVFATFVLSYKLLNLNME